MALTNLWSCHLEKGDQFVKDTVNFVSNGWKQVVIESGILENLKHGYLILADRGFPLEEFVASRGSRFKVCFHERQKQLNEIGTEKTRCIAFVRIHVTRTRFKILKGPMNISFLNTVDNMHSFVDKIVKCVAFSLTFYLVLFLWIDM